MLVSAVEFVVLHRMDAVDDYTKLAESFKITQNVQNGWVDDYAK